MAAAPVLFVFPLSLHGARHGNVQRMLALAEYVRTQGREVDLVFRQETADMSSIPGSVRSLFRRVVWSREGSASSDAAAVCDRIGSFHLDHPPSPFFTPDPAFTVLVRALVETGDYAAVVSTYAWTAPMFLGLSRPVLTVCDVQDVFHQNAAAARRATGAPTMFSLPRSTEELLWTQWDVLVAISEEDRATIARLSKPGQTVISAAHARPIASAPASGADDDVVYVGSDNLCNRESIRWFLDSVWPEIRGKRPAARLRIAGLVASTLTASQVPAGVELAGLVDNLDDFLATAGVVVAPYLYGSGLKIKVVEAAAAGKAIVTSPYGHAGTRLEAGHDLIVSDTAASFADAVIGLAGCIERREAFGTRAHTAARRLYSSEACYSAVGRALETIPPPRKRATAFDIPPAVVTRICDVAEAAGSSRLLLYGYGGHSHALRAALAERGRSVTAILDRHCDASVAIGDGCQRVPAAGFEPAPTDLVVLSSHTFEREMWTDLAHLRKADAHVMGVYDQALVTPALSRLVLAHEQARRQHHGSSRRAKVLNEGGRLFVCDPGIRSYHGHYLTYASGLADAGKRAEIPVVIAGHRSLDQDARLDLGVVDPAFTVDGWSTVVAPSGGRAAEHYVKSAKTFGADLLDVLGRRACSRHDVVFLPTAHFPEVLGLQEVARHLSDRCPQFRVLFRFGIADYGISTGLSVAALETFTQTACWSAVEALGDRISWLSDSEVLCEQYASVTGLSFSTVPIPVALSPAARQPVPGRLLYLGDARLEKGFHRLPEVVEELQSELTSGCASLVVQCPPNPASDSSVSDAMEHLAAAPGVTLVPRSLGPAEYASMLASAEVILLPYSHQRYAARTSGVLAESIGAGLPVVAPDGTWLSRVLAAGHGAGVTFGNGSGRSLAESVRHAWADRASLAKTAIARREPFTSFNTPDQLLSAVL